MDGGREGDAEGVGRDLGAGVEGSLGLVAQGESEGGRVGGVMLNDLKEARRRGTSDDLLGDEEGL